MEEKYETLYYIYKDIKYNTLEEVEKIIQEEKWDEIYSFTIFQIKLWVCLFLISQIIYNIISYWEKRTPYDEETKRKAQELLQIELVKRYMDIERSFQLLSQEEKEEVLEEIRR